MKTVTNKYDVNNLKYFSRSIKNSITIGSCHDSRDSFNGMMTLRMFGENNINIKILSVTYSHTATIRYSNSNLNFNFVISHYDSKCFILI